MGTNKRPGKEWEEGPRSCQSSTYALDRQTQEGSQMLSTQSQVGIQASDPLGGGWTRGSSQNQREPQCTPSILGLWERGLREERFPHMR